MPSTFDSLLRLELQATGENENTWGEKANQNFELIGQAIAGHVSVDIAGSGNKTLTTGNATTDEARRAFITLSGLLTGAVSVIAPTASKLYAIRNNATQAGNPILLKTAAGAAVTVESSSLAWYACDGVDFWRVEDTTKLPLSGGSLAGTLDVSGAVSVGGAANFTSTVSVSGAAAIGGNLTATTVSASNIFLTGGLTAGGAINSSDTAFVSANAFVGSLTVRETCTVGGAIQANVGIRFAASGTYSATFGFGQETLSGVPIIRAITFAPSYDYGYVPVATNVGRFQSLSDGSGNYLEYFDTAGALYGVRAFTSDGRLKIEIRPNTDDNLSIINSLGLRTFKWKANDLQAPIGLIAQEAEAVAPGAVWETEDGTKHIDVLSLTARLIGAVQQLSQRIEELEARIDDLEI